MDKISPELVERMVEFIRQMHAGYGRDGKMIKHDEIEAIVNKFVAELPKPVDPDVIEARKICKNSPAFWVTSPGAEDDPLCALGLVVAAIKRGRELAGGAA